MSTLEKTQSILADLIAFPTISSDSNLDMIAYLAERLKDCGARVELQHRDDGKKANLFASIGPEREGGIILSGHTDVVPVEDQDWSGDPFKMEEREGRLYGRGTCDMKGFIAATIAQAPYYAARKDLRRPIHFSFTYDEETGCLGAQALAPWLRKKGYRPDLAIIGEPTSMKVIEGHKGCCEYRTQFSGQSGHGSLPDEGVNAVEYAVRYVHKLLQIADRLKENAPRESQFNPPWTTINTGMFKGGIARNVIAESAIVDWEFRPITDEDFHSLKREIEAFAEEELLPAMRRVYPQASIRTEIIGEVQGLTPATQNEARDIMTALTGNTVPELVSFGTEAGIFSDLGMATVVCGPGSIAQAHKPDEYIEIAELQRCLDVLEHLH